MFIACPYFWFFVYQAAIKVKTGMLLILLKKEKEKKLIDMKRYLWIKRLSLLKK